MPCNPRDYEKILQNNPIAKHQGTIRIECTILSSTASEYLD